MNFHKDRRNPLAAKRSNTVTLDETWGLSAPEGPLSVYAEDFADFLAVGFGVHTVGSEKKIILKLSPVADHGCTVTVTENTVTFAGGAPDAVMRAAAWAEETMVEYGGPWLPMGEFTLMPVVWPRLFTPAEELTREYLLAALHEGYSGVIPEENGALPLVKSLGLSAYQRAETMVDAWTGIDGLILPQPTQHEPQNFSVIVDLTETTPAEAKAAIEKIPAGDGVWLSFDGGQAREIDGVPFVTVPGSLVQAEPQENLADLMNIARERGLKCWISDSGAGRSAEFGTVPYLPAMMQWLLRLEAVKNLRPDALVESDALGYTPSIVSAFRAKQMRNPHDEAGVTMQKLAAQYYGAANVDKIMMVFKKLTDGVNHLIPEKADLNGPLTYGPAYPLVKDVIYDFPFEEKDITLATDQNLTAADAFNKAAMILKPIEGDGARELRAICGFMANTMASCANAKRWYRRVHVLQTETVDYKRRFLMEQLVKIGRQEIENAVDTAQYLYDCPALCGNRYELLCTLDRLEAKISLTQSAVDEFDQKSRTYQQPRKEEE